MASEPYRGPGLWTVGAVAPDNPCVDRGEIGFATVRVVPLGLTRFDGNSISGSCPRKMSDHGRKKPRRRRSFTPEFKSEILGLCRQGDRSVGQVARDFDLTETAMRSGLSRPGRAYPEDAV